jgi:hypothetical protein
MPSLTEGRLSFLVLDENGSCWLVEVKDYRSAPRTKSIDLAGEVALKVRDSLALLATASRNANDANEAGLARESLKAKRISIVLHLEQPARHSKLFPRAIDPAHVQQRLRQLVKSVDPHPASPKWCTLPRSNGLSRPSLHNKPQQDPRSLRSDNPPLFTSPAHRAREGCADA